MKHFVVCNNENRGILWYLLVSRKPWIRLIDGGGPPYSSSQATRGRLTITFAPKCCQILCKVQDQTFITNNLGKLLIFLVASECVGMLHSILVDIHRLSVLDIVNYPGLPLCWKVGLKNLAAIF